MNVSLCYSGLFAVIISIKSANFIFIDISRNRSFRSEHPSRLSPRLRLSLSKERSQIKAFAEIPKRRASPSILISLKSASVP